jgi:hypothetical protein
VAGDLHRIATSQGGHGRHAEQDRPQRCARHRAHHADRLVPRRSCEDIDMSFLTFAVGRAPDCSQRDEIDRKRGSVDPARNGHQTQNPAAKKLHCLRPGPDRWRGRLGKDDRTSARHSRRDAAGVCKVDQTGSRHRAGRAHLPAPNDLAWRWPPDGSGLPSDDRSAGTVQKIEGCRRRSSGPDPATLSIRRNRRPGTHQPMRRRTGAHGSLASCIATRT